MNTAYKNSIVLQVDEANRTLTNDGKTTPIILGVKGDDCAERVYFECPRILSPEVDLLPDPIAEYESMEKFPEVGESGIVYLALDTNKAYRYESETYLTTDKVKVHVYVNYKSADTNVYVQECKDVAKSATSDVVTFSWLVTNNATAAKGDVKFNVCVKKMVNDALVNEWHTTPFVGKVLDSIDVTRKTSEIITHDSVTLDALMVQVQSYKNNLAALNKSLLDTEAYINRMVETKVSEQFDGNMSIIGEHGTIDVNVDDDISILMYSEGSDAIIEYKRDIIRRIDNQGDGYNYSFPSTSGTFALKEECDNLYVSTQSLQQDIHMTLGDLNVPSYETVQTIEIGGKLAAWANTTNGMSVSLAGCGIANGSKILVYIEDLSNGLENLNKSFILEVNVFCPSGQTGVTGGASHYIYEDSGFEGVMFANFFGQVTGGKYVADGSSFYVSVLNKTSVANKEFTIRKIEIYNR